MKALRREEGSKLAKWCYVIYKQPLKLRDHWAQAPNPERQNSKKRGYLIKIRAFFTVKELDLLAYIKSPQKAKNNNPKEVIMS